MAWSLKLGSVRGIEIKIHVTFLLIIPWSAYNWGVALGRGWSGALYGIGITTIIFGCVVLHELSHSLVAMHYGVRVREIELSPIGGVAKMESMPKKPHQEFVMALAGPLVNLVIAVPLGWIVLALVASRSIRSLGHLMYLMNRPSWQGLILNLFASNVLLGLFNLLPAFPMDGGRVLRSVLAWKLGQREATRFAARVGQGVAGFLALTGLFTGNVMLVFVALFVFAGAQQEERVTEFQAVLGDVPVNKAVMTNCQTLSPDDRLATVLELAMQGHPACFAVIEEQRLVGLLTHMDVSAALEAYGRQARVGDIMRREFRALSPTDTLARAHQLMATSGSRALPVVEAGRFLGVVTAQQIGEIYRLRSIKEPVGEIGKGAVP
jgi:Zn-dependent protease/predicted transcriptional regulator